LLLGYGVRGAKMMTINPYNLRDPMGTIMYIQIMDETQMGA
jgi:hypothetical protein